MCSQTGPKTVRKQKKRFLFLRPNKHDNLKSGVDQILCKHFLQIPCICFDLSLTLVETRNLKKNPKQKRKHLPKLYLSLPILTPLKGSNFWVSGHFQPATCSTFDVDFKSEVENHHTLQPEWKKQEKTKPTKKMKLYWPLPLLTPLQELIGPYVEVFVGGIWEVCWWYLGGILMVKPTKKQPKTCPTTLLFLPTIRPY